MPVDAVLDETIRYLSALCAQEVKCSHRTSDLAQAMYDVNHNMPKRWMFFGIDPDTVRFGTHLLFFSNPTMALAFDAYLAAAKGDASGLAMLNLLASLVPFDPVLGDFFNKGGTIDVEKYGGSDSVSLANSIMGAPLAELVWPMAAEWPLELIPQDLREFQASDVEMLLVNGTVDFSTPPTALEEAQPYFRRAQTVLLPEYSHTGDVMALQPEAFERLITSYYANGVADASLFVYQALPFQPILSLTVVAKLLVAAVVVLPALILLGAVVGVRRMRQSRTAAFNRSEAMQARSYER